MVGSFTEMWVWVYKGKASAVDRSFHIGEWEVRGDGKNKPGLRMGEDTGPEVDERGGELSGSRRGDAVEWKMCWGCRSGR